VLGVYEGPEFPSVVGIVTQRLLRGTLYDCLRPHRSGATFSGMEVLTIALQVAESLYQLNSVSDDYCIGATLMAPFRRFGLPVPISWSRVKHLPCRCGPWCVLVFRVLLAGRCAR
jgi:hypothetical protein